MKFWLRFGLASLVLSTVLYSSCATPNNYPVISSLGAGEDWVAPSRSREVKCIASDADGDTLTYSWSATAGNFSGTGSTATWVAPDAPGSYTITVKVTDGRGGEATANLPMNVKVNHPPVIESLVAEPPAVLQAGTTQVSCVASDPDGDALSYRWTAAAGNISGEGAIVKWTAPNSCAVFKVTVTVNDGNGGEASKELEITVKKPG